MTPKVGDRLGSAACDTEVIVVRPPTTDVELTCGGAPMTAAPAPTPATPAAEEGTLLGKRYTDPESGLELLCTKAGTGTLRVGGVPLSIKQAKNLPSSD
jgi:hypothetical protein